MRIQNELGGAESRPHEFDASHVGQEDKLLLTMTSHLDSEAIVGIDVDYSFLMEDFVFLQEKKAYYFAVLDKSSRSVVYHPHIDKKPGSQFPQGISFDTIEGTYNCLTVYLHLRRPSVLPSLLAA